MTTSSGLDNLREVFTFEVKNVSSYELGKARHGKLPPEPQPDTETASDTLETGESIEEVLTGINAEIRKVSLINII